MNAPIRMHGSVVSVGGRGALLTGGSGLGKSDLALRLIDRGARLVADDQVLLETAADGRLWATAPDALKGLLEVRGLGIIHMPGLDRCPIDLVVRLGPMDSPQRLPDARPWQPPGDPAPMRVPELFMFAFEPSAPIKVELALAEAARIGSSGEV
ncbi:HPr kinase/phosphorylase [Yunchengibacter salinarum]|uniref:HPr kinase/phosphorylase n=1 Tax=Yunchengibacter salinarum TaxID=3133399 RepID=UPI0035B5E480